MLEFIDDLLGKEAVTGDEAIREKLPTLQNLEVEAIL